jgi:hypothetical protein
MSDKPPPFADYISVSGDELWAKILSGEIEAHIYSSEAPGDFEPVPISAAAFFVAEEAGRDEDGAPDPRLKSYQIMVRDRDQRRLSGTRRHIPVPHWLYVAKADLPAPKKPRSGPGAAEQYDWDDIELFVRKLFIDRGDFAKPENRVDKWRSQNDLIEAVKDYLQARNPPQPIPGQTQLKIKVADMLKRIRLELPTGH